jgi:DMSO/TMAO reductase YedYZ molybdopterin-dependent catalytic subunit
MSHISRRKLLRFGLGAGVGITGLTGAAKIANRYGLIPPDYGGIYGPGETLTYATQRLLAGNSFAREFPRHQISGNPFANGTPFREPEFERLKAGGFAEWRLVVDGMVNRPSAFSVAELRSFPPQSQITQLCCEEGWSYIAEWTGVPLHRILNAVGVLPAARYVVYSSMESGWWDSIDITEAQHPQTLVTYGMNGADLPPEFGGPLRMRVPRQLGYKSVKYINRLTVRDTMKGFRSGLGSAAPEYGYAWYAGI